MMAYINVGSINFILPHFPRAVNTFLKSVQSQTENCERKKKQKCTCPSSGE